MDLIVGWYMNDVSPHRRRILYQPAFDSVIFRRNLFNLTYDYVNNLESNNIQHYYRLC
jgi:hypothetical protein